MIFTKKTFINYFFVPRKNWTFIQNLAQNIIFYIESIRDFPIKQLRFLADPKNRIFKFFLTKYLFSIIEKCECSRFSKFLSFIMIWNLPFKKILYKSPIKNGVFAKNRFKSFAKNLESKIKKILSHNLPKICKFRRKILYNRVAFFT